MDGYLFNGHLNKRMDGGWMRIKEREWERKWVWSLTFSFFEKSVKECHHVIMCDGRVTKMRPWKVGKWVTQNLKHWKFIKVDFSSKWKSGWGKRSGLQELTMWKMARQDFPKQLPYTTMLMTWQKYSEFTAQTMVK